jgi:predicted DNA-binding protein
MKMTRMMIQLPWNLKTKLDALRKQGTTASGYIRHLLEKHFKQPSVMKRKEL